MLLASPLATSVRFHWPMQGPQELERTVPPTWEKGKSRAPQVSYRTSHAEAVEAGRGGETDLVEDVHDAVALDGCTDLLGAGADGEGDLGLDAGVQGLLGDGGGAGHVLVGRVGAGADEASLELRGPAGLLDVRGKVGDGGERDRGRRAR